MTTILTNTYVIKYSFINNVLRETVYQILEIQS